MCADAWFHGSSRPAGEDAVACSVSALFAGSAPSEAAKGFGESGKEMNCSSTVAESGFALTLSRTGAFDAGFGSAVALTYSGSMSLVVAVILANRAGRA